MSLPDVWNDFFCIEKDYFASLANELDESNAPNTTLSAILMMYLFRANALDLEFRERWERERMRASLPSMAD